MSKPVVVAQDADADEMNRLHGEAYGTDWVYQKPMAVQELTIRESDGALDEIVGTGPFHLEQMDDNHWWMLLEAGTKRVHVHLQARGRIRATFEEEPADAALQAWPTDAQITRAVDVWFDSEGPDHWRMQNALRAALEVKS